MNGNPQKPTGFDIVIVGLSITSSWGNGHATTYRSLVKGLSRRGHRVLFLERDVPWYSENRDEERPAGAVTQLYVDLEDLTSRFQREIESAKLVVLGSFVHDGPRVGDWITATAKGVTAFYDIDTPVTLARLEEGNNEYLVAALIPRFHLYLSFSGGPALRILESRYGAQMARPFYCSVDESVHRPSLRTPRWDLGYLGTYSPDRQPGLEELLLAPARHWGTGRFAVIGALYPEHLRWPRNVRFQPHLPPALHSDFYGMQRFTLNVTRSEMKRLGYSPSVRLFEAGACGVPIVSDSWNGIEEVYRPGRELLIADTAGEVLRILRDTPERSRKEIGAAARARVLAEHTSVHRAMQLERYLKEINDNILPHPSRGSGRHGIVHSGTAAHRESQPYGQNAGGTIGDSVDVARHTGHLYESAKSGGTDGGDDRRHATASRASRQRVAGIGLRRMGGPGRDRSCS